MAILITGASSGIGEACARAFAAARKGERLVLVARRADRLQKLSKDLTSLGAEVETHVLDVRDAAAVARASFGDIDVLINNAGLARGVDALQDGNPEDWDAMIDTNVKGLLYLTRAVLPGMIARKRGHVINLGSVAGRWVYPKGAVYCASKYAVRALSEGLRQDVHGTGVRVTEIAPGMVETEFSEVRLGSSERAKAVYQGFEPLTAGDIAETVLWCAQRPARVNIQEVVLFPTAQSAVGMVERK